MKKMVVFLVVILAVAFLLPTPASAGDFSARERGIGRFICTPFKAVGRVIVDVVNTVTFQKPAAILAIPKHVRQDAFDLMETAGKVAVGAEPIDIEEVGSVNTKITEAGVDWLVDGVVYGVGTGLIVKDAYNVANTHRHLLDWKAGLWTAGGVIAGDLISDATGVDDD